MKMKALTYAEMLEFVRNNIPDLPVTERNLDWIARLMLNWYDVGRREGVTKTEDAARELEMKFWSAKPG
jgi:hypothetical protein